MNLQSEDKEEVIVSIYDVIIINLCCDFCYVYIDGCRRYDTRLAVAKTVAQMYLSDSKLCYLTTKSKRMSDVCVYQCVCRCVFGVCRFI